MPTTSSPGIGLQHGAMIKSEASSAVISLITSPFFSSLSCTDLSLSLLKNWSFQYLTNLFSDFFFKALRTSSISKCPLARLTYKSSLCCNFKCNKALFRFSAPKGNFISSSNFSNIVVPIRICSFFSLRKTISILFRALAVTIKSSQSPCGFCLSLVSTST